MQTFPPTLDLATVQDYVDKRLPAILAYYFRDDASEVSGYKKATGGPGTNEVAEAFTPGNGTHAIVNYITEPGFPGVAFLPAGSYEFHMHAKRASGQFTMYAEFWETDKDGVDIGLLGTTEEVVVANTESEYRVFFTNADVYEMQSSESRIACRVYAITASNPTCTLYVGGIADSHLSLPSVSVTASTFVPYIIKENSGDPASATPGTICINTADGTIKQYVGAPGGWVSLGSWGGS